MLAICGVCTAPVLAQLTVNVSLVTLEATVTDRNGTYVRDLRAEDFIVIEDGKEQKVALVEQSDDRPMSIGILLDTSDSMRSKIKTATAQIDKFVQSWRPDDEMFLLTFAGKTELVQDFTSDRSKISKALKKVNLSFGTVLYYAVEQGVLKVNKGKNPKKALLVVTDGEDFGSRISLQQAIDDVRDSNVVVYCLGIGDVSSDSRGRYPEGQDPENDPSGYPPPSKSSPNNGPSSTPSTPSPRVVPVPVPQNGPILFQFPFPGRPGGRFPAPPPSPGRGGGSPPPPGDHGFGGTSVDMRVLNSIASSSGGKAFQVSIDSTARSRSIDDVLKEISAELRSQYTIGYHPDHPPNDGKWHQVVVHTKNNSYEVRSRKEYFGGSVVR